MSNNAPIGVYDSGFGGLSVWRELRRLLPDESLVYLGDGKNCPYGGRSRTEIEGFAFAAVERLVNEGVKMVVVGCNTATTAAVESLRQRWCDMPIVGLEPAVKPACLSTHTRKIAVLATEHSLSSDMFLATAARYAEDVEVVKVVGDGFVELVERDWKLLRKHISLIQSLTYNVHTLYITRDLLEDNYMYIFKKIS
jgi:glutamate racemase